MAISVTVERLLQASAQFETRRGGVVIGSAGERGVAPSGRRAWLGGHDVAPLGA